MRERFDNTSLQVKTLEVLQQANTILADYQRQGFVMSLRQLFYQFVRRNWMENTYNNYKRLGEVLKVGRNHGIVDWDFMEDRVRNLTTPFAVENSKHMMDTACHWFNHNPWLDQPNRVEVWVEKDAVFGVINPTCEELRTPHFAARGYASTSELYSAGKRFSQYETQGQRVTVLYLGDHDPSGINMRDDIEKRVCAYSRMDIEVRRIALTMEQIEEFDPPPNTTKEKDSRTAAYEAEFGPVCWELDALNPEDMVKLIRSEVEALIDPDIWEESMAREQEERIKLERVRDKWERVVKYTTPRKRKRKHVKAKS